MNETTYAYHCRACVHNLLRMDEDAREADRICCEVLRAGKTGIISCENWVLSCSEYKEAAK